MEDEHPLARLFELMMSKGNTDGAALVLEAMQLDKESKTELLRTKRDLCLIADLADEGLTLGVMDPMTALRRVQAVTDGYA